MFSVILLLAASMVLPIGARPPSQPTVKAAPKLTLPWGTWEGEPYGPYGETIAFKNVRYGQAPIDKLRFAAPKFPDPIKDPNQVQDKTYGPRCIQAVPKANVSFEPSGNGVQSEDCLFLDVYVPSWALEDGAEPLPVVVWIFGGAYIFGAKDAEFKLSEGSLKAYDGQGISDASNQNLIFVTGNYRLGAFGFLAGSTMESQAQPNAGLHDQRLILEWVQKYIGLVAGDKDNVNVWGISAGAGSIMHHLTAYGGEKKGSRLFNRAVLWSTAFQWGYDRTGALDQTFQKFAAKSKCSSSKTLDCLRKASKDDLAKANQEVVSEALALGMFPFGPAVDGDLVPELPASLLSKGKRVDCDSIIVSHTFDEASLFLADWVKTEADFTKFVALAFPGDKLASTRKKIEEKYPAKSYDSDQHVRMRTILRDSTFVCNKRQIYNAYHNDSAVYAARYEMPPAQHGFDLFATIWHSGVKARDLLGYTAPPLPDFLLDLFDSIWPGFATRYQRYFASHALTGDPNNLGAGRALEWEMTADDGSELTNSLNIGPLYVQPRWPFFQLGRDVQSSTEKCAFWDEVAVEISKVSGKDVSMPTPFRAQGQGLESFELKK